jgi:hypothetical protein
MSDGYFGEQKFWARRICETKCHMRSETIWLLLFVSDWKRSAEYIFSNVFKDFTFIVAWFGMIKEKVSCEPWSKCSTIFGFICQLWCIEKANNFGKIWDWIGELDIMDVSGMMWDKEWFWV